MSTDERPDQLMDIIVEEGKKMGITVHITDDYPREIKACNSIQVILNRSNNRSAEVFRDLRAKEEQGKLSTHLSSARLHQFPGMGQKLSPVLTQELLIEIIMLLPSTTELAKRLQTICRNGVRAAEFMVNETKNIDNLVSLTRAVDFAELQQHALNRCYIVYVGQINVEGVQKHAFKYGRTEKIDDRMTKHALTFDGIEPLCVVCAKSGVALENAFKIWLEENELKATLEFGGKKQVEMFFTTPEFPIQKIYHKFNMLASLGVPHDNLEIMVETLTKQNAQLTSFLECHLRKA